MQVTFSALLKGAGVLKSAGTVSDKFNSLVVTLEGTADSQQTSEKAAAVAEKVEGVRSVVNRLVIDSANSRKGPAMRRLYWQNQVIVHGAPARLQRWPLFRERAAGTAGAWL